MPLSHVWERGWGEGHGGHSNNKMIYKVEISNLKLTFPSRHGPIQAIDNLTLQIPEGELACVVGPSGCGKTSMLRILAGLEQASAGTAIVHTTNPQRPTTGVVFQGAGLFPWMTVQQNVGYGLQMRGMPIAERNAITQHWLAAVGLTQFAHAYPAQLSGGMQQRAGLARAFAYDPEVLLMDEPFAALDAQTRMLQQQMLLEQWEQQRKTVIFVTHSIEEALTLGDQIYVMSARPGKILSSFPVPFARPRDPAALRSDRRFGELFGEVWAALRNERVTG